MHCTSHLTTPAYSCSRSAHVAAAAASTPPVVTLSTLCTSRADSAPSSSCSAAAASGTAVARSTCNAAQQVRWGQARMIVNQDVTQGMLHEWMLKGSGGMRAPCQHEARLRGGGGRHARRVETRPG
eukprot:78958-Chlamydomonas_euryale.AAC.1